MAAFSALPNQGAKPIGQLAQQVAQSSLMQAIGEAVVRRVLKTMVQIVAQRRVLQVHTLAAERGYSRNRRS